MIHAFSAALGVALCALGLIGMGPGLSVADAGQLRSNAVHDVLCVLIGIVLLMGTVERGWVARRLCLIAAATHAAVGVVALFSARAVSPLFSFSAIDLCVSWFVVVSCLAVLRVRPSARRRLAVYGKFDTRLTAARPELLALEE